MRLAANQGIKDIEVLKIDHPQLFFNSDITYDKNDWKNIAVAKYFGFDSIVIKDPDTIELHD
ncbi:MAG: hypothetical protein JEZ07_01900 [Phycisphaerae bacterium]|nr:hypothetical protein [Phycisphaerae bacterium]